MSRRWHKPRWYALPLLLFGLAVFCTLGGWQLDRAQQKRALFAAFDGAATQPTLALDLVRRGAQDGRYPHVRVTGRYVEGRTYLLDNQSRDGRAGVLVYDAFDPADGSQPLLVARGFLARGEGRAVLPPPAPAGAQVLSGLYVPTPGIGLRLGGNALPTQETWPKLTIYLDPHEIGADLGRQLDPRLLLLDADPASGFVREWRPQLFPPERHYGYAFTWFTFALVALVIFLLMHWRTNGAAR